MLIHSHDLTDRAAYEVFDAYEARLELYRVTTNWFYIVVALFPPYPDEPGNYIVRRALPGRFTSEGEGIEGLTDMAATIEQETRDEVARQIAEAEAEGLRERRNDPSDPLYWANDWPDEAAEEVA